MVSCQLLILFKVRVFIRFRGLSFSRLYLGKVLLSDYDSCLGF